MNVSWFDQKQNGSSNKANTELKAVKAPTTLPFTNNNKNGPKNNNNLPTNSIYDILQISLLQTQLNCVEKTSSKSSRSTSCISGEVSNCPQAHQLAQAIQQYNIFVNTNNNNYNIEKINILNVLNNFLHMLQFHDNDQQFEAIKNIFNVSCVIQKCRIFKNIHPQNHYNSHRHAYLYQILNKIHCYYEHSHDIGNRLTIREKISIIDTIDDSVYIREDEKCDVVNNQIKKLNDILSTKQQQNIFTTTRAKKYNDFLAQKSTKSDKMYCLGVEFVYGYDNEIIVNPDNYIRVYKKYNDLKQELLKNAITTVGLAEYDTEYRKAQTHYNSNHRREKYPSMTSGQILSLMFYCNCDNLQFVFSKTYREKQNEHNNFYHLGQFIKSAIHNFGTKMIDGNMNVFYHGIGEKLLFPNLKIRIDCPTSTSSQFQVALGFTNQNNGLIVAFNGIDSPVKYFSCAWLSDYAYESEYLFIHNETYIEINNIMDPKSGSEFTHIIHAFKIMDKIFTGNNVTGLTSHQNRLIIKCFHHQLSYSDPNKYKRFNSLHNYAKRMIIVYCKRIKKIIIDTSLKNVFPTLFQLLFYTQFNGVNTEVINLLFPNIEYIVGREINLCSQTFDCILSHLNRMDIDTKLNKIKILPNQNSKSNIMNIISTYSHSFNELSFMCHIDQINENWICITKKPKIKITLDLPDNDFDGYDSARSVSVSSNCSSIIEISYGDKGNYTSSTTCCDDDNEIRFSCIPTPQTPTTPCYGLNTASRAISDISFHRESSYSSSLYPKHSNHNKIKIRGKRVHFESDLSNGFPDIDEKKSENTLFESLSTMVSVPKISTSCSTSSCSSIHKYRRRTPSTPYTSITSYNSYPYSSMVQSHTINDDQSSCFAFIDEKPKTFNKQQNKSSKKLKGKKNKKQKNKKKKIKKYFKNKLLKFG